MIWLQLLTRYWHIAAIAAAVAWGGIGWYGKAASERSFAEYQRAAAETISTELLRHQATQQKQAAIAGEASRQYQKGATHVRTTLQPELDELATLRTLWAARTHSLRQPTETDSSPLPATPDPTGGPDATACTDRPGDIAAAAAAVARDLASCAGELEKLKGLQQWAEGISGTGRGTQD